MQFADPKNDLAFKKIFGNENKKEILISFLNAVLDFKGNKAIVDLALANPYQVPRIPELKETILDIKATNADRQTFIVEMQKKHLSAFHKRSLYYTAKAYVEQLDVGKDYKELKKVYFIGILDFIMFDNIDCVSRHLIINQETGRQDIDDFEFTFIELPKFKKELKALKTIFDKWIYFIKNASSLSMIPRVYEGLPAFQEAFNIARQSNWNRKELEIYDYVALKAFDDIHALDTAKEEGRKEGREEGREEGRLARNIEIAKASLAKGLDTQIVSDITGLSSEQIKDLETV